MGKSKLSILIIGILMIVITAAATYFGLSSVGLVGIPERSIDIKIADKKLAYDGKPHELEDYEVLSSDMPDEFELVVDIDEVKLKDAGSKKINADVRVLDTKGVDVTKEYKINVIPGTLTIEKLSLSFDLKDFHLEAGHKKPELSELCELIEGELPDGFQFKLNNDVTANIGDNKISKDNIVILDINGVDVTYNFAVEANDGNVQLDQKPIEFLPQNIIKEYDQTDIYDDVVTLPHGSLRAGDTYAITYEERFTEVGVHEPKIKDVVIYDKNGEDVTRLYDIKVPGGYGEDHQGDSLQNPGTLTIKQRIINITTSDHTFIYDGELHSSYDFEGDDTVKLYDVDKNDLDFLEKNQYKVELFVKEEYEFPVIENFGTVPNNLQFRITDKDNNELSDSLLIEVEAGTLTLLPMDLYLTTGDDEVEFGKKLDSIKYPGNLYFNYDYTIDNEGLDVTLKAFIKEELEIDSTKSTKINIDNTVGEFENKLVFVENDFYKNVNIHFTYGNLTVTKKTLAADDLTFNKIVTVFDGINTLDALKKATLADESVLVPGHRFVIKDYDRAQIFNNLPSLDEPGQNPDPLDILSGKWEVISWDIYNSKNESVKDCYDYSSSKALTVPFELKERSISGYAENYVATYTGEDIMAADESGNPYYAVHVSSTLPAMTSYIAQDSGTAYADANVYSGEISVTLTFSTEYLDKMYDTTIFFTDATFYSDFIIKKANFTVTMPSLTKTYDQDDFGTLLTFSFKLPDGNNLELVGVDETLGEAGTYQYTAEEVVNDNYIISIIPGILTINKLDVTVRMPSLTKTYDGEFFDNYKGVISSTLVTDIDLDYSYESEADGTAAGTYENTAKYTGTDSNVNVIIIPGKLTIKKLDVNFTMPSLTKTYDRRKFTNFKGTSSSNLVNAERDFEYTYDDEFDGASAGTYENSARYTGGDDNVNVIIIPGKLTINKLDVTVTMPSLTKNYDAKEFTNYKGISSNPLLLNVNLDLDYTYADESDGVSVGTYVNSATYNGDDDNINVIIVPGILTIKKLDVTVTMPSLTKNYDTGEFTNYKGVSSSTLVNVNSDLDYTYAGELDGASAGTYVNSAKYIGGDDNLNVIIVPGTLTINKLEVTVTMPSLTKTYDKKPFTGFEGSSSNELVDASTDLIYTYVDDVDAKTYVNSATYNGGDDNLNVIIVPGTLTINKLDVTVRMPSLTKTYDSTEFTNYKGVSSSTLVNVNSDLDYTYDSELDGTEAKTYVNSAIYNGGDDNLNVIIVPGTLTINKLDVTLDLPDLYKVYDGFAFENYKGTSSSDLVDAERDFDYSYDEEYDQTAAGIYSNNAKYVGGNAANLNITVNRGTLTIERARIVVETVSATFNYGNVNTSETERINVISGDNSLSLEIESVLKFKLRLDNFSDRGTYQNVAYIEDSDNTISRNIEVEVRFGTITIK